MKKRKAKETAHTHAFELESPCTAMDLRLFAEGVGKALVDQIDVDDELTALVVKINEWLGLKEGHSRRLTPEKVIPVMILLQTEHPEATQGDLSMLLAMTTLPDDWAREVELDLHRLRFRIKNPEIVKRLESLES